MNIRLNRRRAHLDDVPNARLALLNRWHMMPVFGSIRFRLLVLITVALLPVVFFSLYLVSERRQDELLRAKERVSVLAHLIASRQSTVLAQSKQLLAGMVLGNNSYDDVLLGKQCSAELRSIMQMYPGYKQAVIARKNGEVFCAANSLEHPINLSGQNFFKETVAEKRSSHSGIEDSRLGDAKTILVAEPVLDESENVIAVLIVEIGMEWLAEYLQSPNHEDEIDLTVVDSSGFVLAAYPREFLVGQYIHNLLPFRAAVASQDVGMMDIVGKDGIARVSAYEKIEGLTKPNVYIRVGLPKSLVARSAQHMLYSMMFGFFLVLLFALIAGWFGAKFLFIEPIRKLTAAVKRLGEGDLSARTGIKEGNSEVGLLAQKFDELAARVQRTTRALTALSGGNRTILREANEEDLLRSMCKVAVEKAGYPVAVVAYLNHDNDRSMEIKAISGNDGGLLNGEKPLTWSDTPQGQGTMGTAARTGKRSVIRFISKDPRAEPWREAAIHLGFRSISSFPLKIDDEVIGTFGLIASQEDAFDEDELNLLDEMAADLSFGIKTIRAQKRLATAERRVERFETHDPLTDLPNSGAFLASVTRAIRAADVGQDAVTILVVHITHLQDVYDSLGYTPGNLIVQELALRLGAMVDDDASLSRLSFEDFGIILSSLDARESTNIVYRILSECQTPTEAGGIHFEIQVAIGASYFPGHGESADLLVRRATIAAREAARRVVPYAAYQGATERENPLRLSLAADLRAAIENRILVLHYQPKVEIKTGKWMSCEALIRWPKEDQGMIPPSVFIPIAEHTGLIRELTYYVIESAVKQQYAWLKEGKATPIAINLSVRNLYDAMFMEYIDQLLRTWGVPEDLIEFEITESALMDEPEIAHAAIAKLRSKGFRMYIDDFGTGYSSLSYLVSLPLYGLKIDRSFVVQMTKSAAAKSVVESIVSMSHGLGLIVVAEGVETAEEFAALEGMGCELVQGYFSGKPVASADYRPPVWT